MTRYVYHTTDIKETYKTEHTLGRARETWYGRFYLLRNPVALVILT
jgi:hypothetical protein